MSKKAIWWIVIIIVILLILWFVLAGRGKKEQGTKMSSIQNAPAVVQKTTNQHA